MRRFFLDFDRPTEGFKPTFQYLDAAFEARSTIPVSGKHEGVALSYDLGIESITKGRLGGRTILEFSGVTRPDAIPYAAAYRDHVPNQQLEVWIEFAKSASIINNPDTKNLTQSPRLQGKHQQTGSF